MLAKAGARAEELTVAAELDATVGDPGIQLKDLTHGVDLIVIGSRRWGTFARVVQGSVGETLVGGAASSVLVVPRPARAVAGRAAPGRTATAG